MAQPVTPIQVQSFINAHSRMPMRAMMFSENVDDILRFGMWPIPDSRNTCTVRMQQGQTMTHLSLQTVRRMLNKRALCSPFTRWDTWEGGISKEPKVLVGTWNVSQQDKLVQISLTPDSINDAAPTFTLPTWAMPQLHHDLEILLQDRGKTWEDIPLPLPALATTQPLAGTGHIVPLQETLLQPRHK